MHRATHWATGHAGAPFLDPAVAVDPAQDRQDARRVPARLVVVADYHVRTKAELTAGDESNLSRALALETLSAPKLGHRRPAQAGAEFHGAACPGQGLGGAQSREVLYALRVANDDPAGGSELVVVTALHDPTTDGLVTELAHVSTRFQPSLMQASDYVAPHLQRPQLRLEVRGQPVARSVPRGQPKGLEVPQTAAVEGGPGVRAAHAILDLKIGVGGLQESPIEPGEAISLGFAPYPLLGLYPGQIAQQLVSHLLSPGSKPIADVVAWNDEVAAGRATTANQDVRVRLVGVEVTDAQPLQVRLPEVFRDTLHGLAGEAPEVGDAITVFR